MPDHQGGGYGPYGAADEPQFEDVVEAPRGTSHADSPANSPADEIIDHGRDPLPRKWVIAGGVLLVGAAVVALVIHGVGSHPTATPAPSTAQPSPVIPFSTPAFSDATDSIAFRPVGSCPPRLRCLTIDPKESVTSAVSTALGSTLGTPTALQVRDQVIAGSYPGPDLSRDVVYSRVITAKLPDSRGIVVVLSRSMNVASDQIEPPNVASAGTILIASDGIPPLTVTTLLAVPGHNKTQAKTLQSRLQHLAEDRRLAHGMI